MPGQEESSELLYPAWQTEYQSAVVEADPHLLVKRIEEAESAIMKRLEAIADNADHYDERRAIEDALSTLRVLKREGD